MHYRFRMHLLGAVGAPAQDGGRSLAARGPAEALLEAAAYWSASHRGAVGYLVVDTEDGGIVYRSQP